MKNAVILVAIIGICLIAATIPVVNASDFSVNVRFLSFVPDRWIEIDYILAVELEIPSVGHYDEKRTDCSRYLSQIPSLEFSVKKSWVGLNAKVTIFARWHAIDALIDINPNPYDGRWTPQGKQASALVVWYVIGDPTKEIAADGNNDGYLTDLGNDAYIRLMIETLIPRFDLTIEQFEGGETLPSPGTYAYVEGEVITVTAMPHSGYKFSHWILDGQIIKTENPEITVAMNSQHTLRAVFAKEETQLWIVFAITAAALTAGLLVILGYRRHRFRKKMPQGTLTL
jgi:hypothetical protein